MLRENTNWRKRNPFLNLFFFFFPFFVLPLRHNVPSELQLVCINLLLVWSLGTVQPPDYVPVGDPGGHKPGCRAGKEFGAGHKQHEKERQKLSAQEGSQFHRAAPACHRRTLLSPHIHLWTPRHHQLLQATAQALSDLNKHLLRPPEPTDWSRQQQQPRNELEPAAEPKHTAADGI